MKAFAVVSIVLALADPAAADGLVLDGPAVAGGLIVGRAGPGASVRVDGRSVRVSDDGRFLIGFGREAQKPVTVRAVFADGRTVERRLGVRRRAYQVQRIDGLPERQVTPSAEDLVRIRIEADLIRSARERDAPGSRFASGFAWPLAGRLSGVYGSQRLLNGEPRQPHFGVDVVAPEGTAVAAAADAVVALAAREMFFTGNTLILDHGHGLTSVYAHLSEILVAEGQAVARGQPVAKVGASGRVTGAHLHWGLSLLGVPLDPALAAGPMPAAGP